MRIDQLLQHHSPSISFEFFPPKTEAGFGTLYQTVEDLRPLRPGYVSVTYGAGGSTRQKTVELVQRIERDAGITAMAHLTCVSHTAEEIAAILDELWLGGIRNVLALRGDPPAGQARFQATDGGFAYANELVRFIRARQDFCIGVAGYPEGHPQCLNRTRDLENLRKKIDAGANFIITQLFFDNAEFLRFRDDARRLGIEVPIVAGIMPIQNLGQIKRMIGMCGATIPQGLLVQLEELEADGAAVEQAGIDFAIAQCRDLLNNGVDGLHFYTLNKSLATVEICRALGSPCPEGVLV